MKLKGLFIVVDQRIIVTICICTFILPVLSLLSISFYLELAFASKIVLIADTIHVGLRPHSMEFLLGKLYVTNSGSDSVSVIDFKTDKVVSTIKVGTDPHGIAAINTANQYGNFEQATDEYLQFPYVYVANTDSNSVSVIDINADRVIATIPVGENPIDIIASNESGKVYVTNSGSNSISIIDSKTNEVIESIPVGSTPQGLGQIFHNETNDRSGPAVATVYVVNTASDTVSAINGNTNKVIDTIHVGKEPHGIIANDLVSQLYIANTGSDSVSIVDAKTRKVATIPVGKEPHRLDIYKGKIYVTNTASDSVSVIDPKDKKVLATIPVATSPRDIAIDNNIGYAFTSNKDANNISIIDLKTNNVVSTIPVGHTPNDVLVAYLAPFYKIYVTNSDSNSVSVIARQENPHSS